jgi:hypothetical protein
VHASYCYPWSSPLYVPHYLIRDCFGEKLLNIKCLFRFSLQILSETFLILRRTEREMMKKYIGLPVKYPLFLSWSNKTRIFSTVFRNVITYQISCKPVEWKPSYSIRTHGRTDRHDKANIRFSQFFELTNKDKFN